MTTVTNIGQPILVHIDGNVKINVDGILSAIVDGSIFNYPEMSGGRLTLMSKKYYLGSWFYSVLGSLIDHAETSDGIWFANTWTETLKDGYVLNGIWDSVFYDEFVFLVSEDLIKFDSFETLTDEQIWNNCLKSDYKKESETAPEYLKPLLTSTTKEELKSEYKKVIKSLFVAGSYSDEEAVKEITITYSKMIKVLN